MVILTRSDLNLKTFADVIKFAFDGCIHVPNIEQYF